MNTMNQPTSLNVGPWLRKYDVLFRQAAHKAKVPFETVADYCCMADDAALDQNTPDRLATEIREYLGK